MALKLVTAPPGTGKTLLLIDMIFAYLKEGRRVYANIDQLQIAEVLPLPHNADWRDFPDGSVVIYDEAQEHYSFSADDLTNFEEFEEPDQLVNERITEYKERISKLKRQYNIEIKNKKRSIRDIASGLQIHRHFGFDIILATQDSSLLNQRTRSIVGEHYHLIRPFGSKMNTIYFWRKCADNPDSRESQKHCEWKKTKSFNKNYFHLYRSANVHTHKMNIPFKYIVFALFAICLICLPFYMASKSPAFNMMTNKDVKSEPTDTVINQNMPTDLKDFKPTSTSEPQQTDQQLEENRIAMISESSEYCRAYSGSGDIIELEDALCRKYSKNPRQLKASAVKRNIERQSEHLPTNQTLGQPQQSNTYQNGSVTYNPTNL